MDEHKKEALRCDLAALINKHSLENGSDTSDFILAEYLMDCLETWDRWVVRRDGWYGRVSGEASKAPTGATEPPVA